MVKSRASYIVGSMTRQPGERPLVILMTSTHPFTDRNLCKTGHEIYNLDVPNFPIKWQKEHTVPSNMHIINALEEMPCRPDLIISQNVVDQYNTWVQIAYQFDCPLVTFEHTLPTPEWIKQGIPQRLVETLRPLPRVFITDFSRKEWGCADIQNAFTLYHMVDTDQYKDWQGGNKRAMLMVNAFGSRTWAVGDVDRLLSLDGGQRIDLFGHNIGYNSRPLLGHEVVGILQQYDVFINTSERSPLPVSLLEAAAVGMPIVSTRTCDIPKFFENERNILFYDSYEECLKQTDRLLQDKILAKKLGSAARQTVLEHFNTQRYLDDWQKIIKFTIDNYHV